MYIDEEKLEQLQAPLRELTAQVTIHGDKVLDTTQSYFHNITTVTGVYNKEHQTRATLDYINLVDIADITTTVTVSVDVYIPKGTYYFSADMSNDVNLRYGYVVFEYQNGGTLTKNFSNSYRYANAVVFAADVRKIHFNTRNGGTFNYKNIQVSKYQTNIYHKYDTTHFEDITLYLKGVNLLDIFDTVEVESKRDINLFTTLPKGNYCFTADITSTDTDSEYSAIEIFYSDGDSEIFEIERDIRVVTLIYATKPFNAIRLYAANNYDNSYGDTAKFNECCLCYELWQHEYKEPIQAIPLPVEQDGTVYFSTLDGMDGFTLVSDCENIAILNLNYQYIDSEYVYYELTNYDDLISYQIDRTGANNKYFGYGICQKLTMKIRDTDNAYIFLDNSKYIMISMDEWDIVAPTFYVDSVIRDENTNTLTVTAYDAIEKLSKHTVAELNLQTPYTIEDLFYAISNVFAGDYITNYDDIIEILTLEYENGANFDGTETLREVMDAIAEIAHCIYYMGMWNDVVFKRLEKDIQALLPIDKSQYFELETGESRALTTIVSATDLGDNLTAVNDNVDFSCNIAINNKYITDTQYIRNNPLLDLREDRAEVLEGIAQYTGGLVITPFTLTWRGNYLLELGDKVDIETKNGSYFTAYILNDTITYNGGYKQVSKWEYTAEEETASNPVTIGEVIKQTYAKVDKQEKRIDLVASENSANSENISALQVNTESINASVTEISRSTEEALDAIDGELEELTNKVNLSMSAEQVQLQIQTELANGVNKVETSTGFTFNEDGLTVAKSTSNITTTITEDGMSVSNDGNKVLVANNEGVKAEDLHATTYLIIGNYSRLQNYPNSKRTACFWIGG